jgi:hypothetical protein
MSTPRDAATKPRKLAAHNNKPGSSSSSSSGDLSALESASGSGGSGSGSGSGDANWYQSSKIPLMYLVVLAASMSLPYFRKLNKIFPYTHPGLVAILSGVIVTLLTYGPMRYADPKYAFSNALLAGMLVAEFNVYGAPYDFPAPVAISFFFFMFAYGREEATELWPRTYGQQQQEQQ